MSMPSTEGVKFVGNKAVPFNVEFSITETAKPGVLGKALSGAIAASKEDVKQLAETKVKLAVSASERQAARSAATTAANTALTAYTSAFADWEAANEALAKVPAGNAATKQKAQLTVQVRKSMLDNAAAAAKDALENAGIPFTPIPTTN
jgi:phosphoribosylformylglycinamidine (FGAM) synthase PurS component